MSQKRADLVAKHKAHEEALDACRDAIGGAQWLAKDPTTLPDEVREAHAAFACAQDRRYAAIADLRRPRGE